MAPDPYPARSAPILVVRRIRDSTTARVFGHGINKRCPIRPDLTEKHVESGRIGVQSEGAN